MNRNEFEESENSECNVCGAPVEIGTASSRCSDRDCPTRDRDNNLSTNSDPTEIIEYWQGRAEAAEQNLRDGLSEEEVKDKALDYFEEYVLAVSREDAEVAEIKADAYLEELDVGWGWLKEKHREL